MRRPPAYNMAAAIPLHREFHIRADAAEIVVHAEQEDQGRRHEDGGQRLQEERRMQGGMADGPDSSDAHACAETQENRNSAQTGQRAGVHVAFLRGNGDEAVGRREIAHVPRQNERR